MGGTLTALLVLVGVALCAVGARRVGRALRRANSLELIRGIRAVIVGVVAMLCAVAMASGQTGLYGLAAVFLAEEIYETALVAWIIRSADG